MYAIIRPLQAAVKDAPRRKDPGSQGQSCDPGPTADLAVALDPGIDLLAADTWSDREGSRRLSAGLPHLPKQVDALQVGRRSVRRGAGYVAALLPEVPALQPPARGPCRLEPPRG